MTDNKKIIFKLAILGFSEVHKKVLKSIFRLSNSRIRTYQFVDSIAQAQMVLLNADNNNVHQFWNKYRKIHKSKSKTDIWIGKDESLKKTKNHHIKYPLVASRVFSELDSVTINDYGYAPELTIGENEQTQILSETLHANTNNSLNLNKHKVLVVDDSEVIRKQIKIELEGMNIQADFASSGEQALTFVDNYNYDLIFLDILMPGINGYKVCKTIKKNILNKNIHIVMLSSKTSGVDKFRAKLAGCNAYLTKPVSHSDFCNKVNQIIYKENNDNHLLSSPIRI